jgi:cytoskeletal protein CcmA (bactofilin family)
MAQIIKHRRGSITQLKDVTARAGEMVVATGSIGAMNGPWVFIGDTEVAGGYRPISKIYEGASAPPVLAGSYGTTVDGTPFYSTTDEALYILASGGNRKIDLTGNIEGNVISGVTINNLTGSNANITNITGGTGNFTTALSASHVRFSNNLYVGGDSQFIGNITGSNLKLTGNAVIDGNITLGGNIIVGDGDTDYVSFGAEISSSIIPDVSNAFDLGSSEKTWRNLHVGTSIYTNGLVVTGNTTLGDNSGDVVNITGSLNVQGSSTLTGAVSASAFTGSFIGDGSQLTGIVSTLYVTASDGTTTSIGDVSLKTETITFAGQSAKGLTTSFNDGTNTVQYELAQDIRTGATTTFNQVILGAQATGTTQTVRADRNLTVTGTTNQVTVVGGTQNLTGDRTWTVSLPQTVDLGTGSTLNSTSANHTNLVSTNITGGTLTITGGTTIAGDLSITGNLSLLGSATEVHISSSVVEIDDNIIRLNAYAPFERYAGFEVIDSGSSGISASLVWDSQNDYWMFVSSSGQSSKLIGTTPSTYGSENSLTLDRLTKATGTSSIGDSLMSDNGTTLAYNTNKFTVQSSDGATLIAGNVTLSSAGGSDGNSKSSAIMFRNNTNVVGYVSTTETTDVLDGILGYKNSNGALVFSTVIDGGTY